MCMTAHMYATGSLKNIKVYAVLLTNPHFPDQCKFLKPVWSRDLWSLWQSSGGESSGCRGCPTGLLKSSLQFQKLLSHGTKLTTHMWGAGLIGTTCLTLLSGTNRETCLWRNGLVLPYWERERLSSGVMRSGHIVIKHRYCRKPGGAIQLHYVILNYCCKIMWLSKFKTNWLT